MIIFKRIIFYFIILILLWIAMGIISGFYNSFDKKIAYDYFITKNVEYKTLYSKKKDNLILYGILHYDYNEDYILIVKLKGSGYTCKNSNKIRFSKRIVFLIIDKTNNKIFSTESEKDFSLMKKKLLISLPFIIDYELFNKVFKKARYIDNNFNYINECKDVNSYPIIKY